ncbi:MAG: hypothetical protein ACYCW6_04385 [Candidatus Xenobia bacterium]
MGFSEDLERAVRETRILRSRRSRLLTVGSTELPYVLLCASLVNQGDTVVRRGLVRVDKPKLLLLGQNQQQYEGFEDSGSQEERELILAIGRAASFPPGKYHNIESELDVFEGNLDNASSHWLGQLDRMEDVLTGVVTGPVELWPLSLLVYVGSLVARSANSDVQELLERRHREFPLN